jgi:RNA polymerase sigma factor (sigma-70 family)
MAVSFEEAFAREFPPLHRYLCRRIGRAADDVAAETFAVAFRQWDRFDQERPLRPWLYGIAANILRHHWRDERRLLRAYARSGVDPVLDETADVVSRLDAGGLHRQLAEALAELRPRQREILLLHAWADLSDAEISQALSIPLGSVKSGLHGARERLRNRLHASGQEKAMTLTAKAKDAR